MQHTESHNFCRDICDVFRLTALTHRFYLCLFKRTRGDSSPLRVNQINPVQDLLPGFESRRFGAQLLVIQISALPATHSRFYHRVNERLTPVTLRRAMNH